MTTALLILAILTMACECLAVRRKWRRVEYFAKPAALLLLLIWFLLAGGLSGPLTWFALGLSFSLAGDTLLLLGGERWFIPGLGAFLLVHVTYFLGFNSPFPSLDPMTIFVGFMVVVSVLPVIRRILAGVKQTGQDALLLPVQVYAAAISLMLFSALLTLFRQDWLAGPAYLVSLGAVLFVTSDFMLAWGKFIKPLRNGPLLVMATYYLGQLLLAAGALGQFVPVK